MKNVGKMVAKALLTLALVAVLVCVVPIVLIWASFTFGGDTIEKKPWNEVIERDLDIVIESGF